MARKGGAKLFDLNVADCLASYRHHYCGKHPAAEYLYSDVILRFAAHEYFSDDFIRAVYATLDSWNMNARAASLVDFATFAATVRACFPMMQKLAGRDISEFLTDAELGRDVMGLFCALAPVCDQAAKIVTVSKTMHFFLPRLVSPIDRQYTSHIIYVKFDGTSVAQQASEFVRVQSLFAEFARDNGLAAVAATLGFGVPKAVDSIIIGARLIQKNGVK